MPSLALIFHLVEIVQSGIVGPVSLDAARLAAMWGEYLKQHARRIYAAELYPDLTAAHLLATKIMAGAISDETNVRDIYRPQWAGLTKPDVVWGGLEKLKEHNFIRITQKETGGRQAEVILINPAAKRRAA
jgi:CRISPR/Cas system-associated protein Csm6